MVQKNPEKMWFMNFSSSHCFNNSNGNEQRNETFGFEAQRDFNAQLDPN